MPIIKSAIKRMRTSAKRRARNVVLKNDIKTAVKAFRAKPSASTLSAAQSQYDKAVKKNLLKINTASRRKAQLAKEAKAAGVKLATGTKKSAKPTAKKTPVKKAAAKSPAKKKVPAAKKTTKKA
jgi:small subunit ribosomal protein S20